MQRSSEVAFCTRDRRRQSTSKLKKKKKKKGGGGSLIRAIFGPKITSADSPLIRSNTVHENTTLFTRWEYPWNQFTNMYRN